MEARNAKFSVVNKSERQPYKGKSKAWSHQVELTNLKGQQVCLETRDVIVKGTLLEADQFTVKIDVLEELDGPVGCTPTIFFKHAIVSINRF